MTTQTPRIARPAHIRPKIYKHRKIVHLSDEQLKGVNALCLLTEFQTKDNRESRAVVIRAGVDLLIERLKPIVDGINAALELDAPQEVRQNELLRVYLNHLPLLENLPIKS